MNAYSMIAADDALLLANQRMHELHRESAVARMHSRTSRLGLFARIAAAVSALRTGIPTVDTDFTTLPSLSEYPYRG